ncbi:hypothetical protein [Cardiobacterium hominis]|uniref:DUF7210 family protein n=1 Tax=Cardiobacterium hominis TaxID=2718 RepID=UPI0028D1EC50|nr:hypothetical protein [Cardiobacterium hominis]
MTGKNTTTPATPAATPSGVPVRLRSPAVIGNIDFAAGATVTVPPETADWLVANGTAVIIDAPNTEEAVTPKRK